MKTTRLYHELADWWPLLSPPEEYAEEAEFYRLILERFTNARAQTLLELGSGGGNNASFLKARFDMTLVDCAPAMLAVSRALNPGCEHVNGDMRTVRLNRQFDCVFVHDAIAYMTTEADLRQAFETAFTHCLPGGIALFVADYVRETFCESTEHGGHDSGGRGLRYLEWTWDPDPSDSTYLVDFAYLLREIDGTTRVEHDRHLEGVFPRACWLRLLREVGFQPQQVEWEGVGETPTTAQLFVGIRPGDSR